MTTAEIIDRLQQASANLFWSSESDYPFEIMTWERGTEMTTPALFPDLIMTDPQVETTTLTDFLAPALTTEDWYEEEELATVDRYQDLFQSIETHLTDVRVFRIGECEITIYIVGKTPDGDIIGLKTQSVET
jgi:Nuclease A inhibitor-like protein